jgi:hypothetical protein
VWPAFGEVGLEDACAELFCAAEGTAPTDGYVRRTVNVTRQLVPALTMSVPARSRVSLVPLNAAFAVQVPLVTVGAAWMVIVGVPLENVPGR